jgi:hypothetical protein
METHGDPVYISFFPRGPLAKWRALALNIMHHRTSKSPQVRCVADANYYCAPEIAQLQRMTPNMLYASKSRPNPEFAPLRLLAPIAAKVSLSLALFLRKVVAAKSGRFSICVLPLTVECPNDATTWPHS